MWNNRITEIKEQKKIDERFEAHNEILSRMIEKKT